MRSPSDNAFIVARHDPPKLGIGTALEPETGQDDCASGQGEEIRETRGAGLTFFRGWPGAAEYFTGPCGCLVGAVTKSSKRRAEKRKRIPPFCEAGHTPVMPHYRRNRVPGGTYFFTVNLLDRRSNLLVARIDALRDAVRQVRARAPFHIDAWVVLPDHMHCLWTLPEDDANFPGRWRAIKTAFVKSLPVGEPRSLVMNNRGARGIWQLPYWEHTIRDDRDSAAHMDYIHFNPVKHGLVAHPADWPHS